MENKFTTSAGVLIIDEQGLAATETDLVILS